MAVILSCGHEDEHRPITGWPIMLKSSDCDAVTGFHRAVSYESYCRACYIRAIENFPEDILLHDWEVTDYLDGGE